ncbi:EscU/YscU/HrcU family type III secretion system export apparatus switch protein [Aneurinibacillus aneurinilyticus]|uniref:Putative FlhB domain protein n=1 Tax=Aneurinibacillus aneurinilyticus ATCC 12856 TaxID=649747 RepID=U1W7K2_ANEAE|nr:EscU/YscU/HrcU family type III secretion system export apparatus switch protein [Aneurinibacillus aneurinilyticus]ERI04474.1 putative FlhB domain protein [Aneurinibacillus aneurinilyticus ATCC 12856]
MMYRQIANMPKKKGSPTRAAVIRYDKENDKAPIVVAQGEGEIADKIIAKAKEHDIPLQEDSMLLENLLELDLGNNVPPQLYQVVAEVLLLVRRANVGEMVPAMPRTVQQTPYWDDMEDEEDVSLEDLLQAIDSIKG